MTTEKETLRRRKYPRIKEACNVRYRLIEGPTVQAESRSGMTRNISGGGMCFSADQPFKVGAMVALEMSLSEFPSPVVSLGRVVWCEQAEGRGRYDVGVEFWWIGWADAEAQTRMLKYVHEKLNELEVGPIGKTPLAALRACSCPCS